MVSKNRAFLCLCGCVLLLLTTNISLLGQAQRATVSHPVHHDVSLPIREYPPIPPTPTPENEILPWRAVPNAGATTPQGPDTVLQSTPGLALNTTPGVSFIGVGKGLGTFNPCCAPPDTNMAVGPNHIVQWANLSYAVFDKTGALLSGPNAGSNFWTGFGGPCETNQGGDPIAQYDRLADRWVMAQLANTGGPTYYQCIAVSTSPDPLGSYNRYAYTFTSLNDYPKMGIWPDAYYMSFNMFLAGAFFQGAQACAYDRNAMLAGGSSPAQVCFQQGSGVGSLMPSDLDGATPPNAGEPDFYMNFGTNVINLWKFHVDFANTANSTFTGPTTLNVASFSEACGGGTCVPQPNTTQQLDSLADRLMYRLAYRNFGSFESLVVNHSVAAGSSVGERWYEVRDPNGSPTLFQQGTYAPTTDTNYRWMGSIAMDAVGNIALGYSASSSSLHPSIYYTGREPGDPLGTMQSEGTIIAGSGSQTGGLSRWGDYSAMRIDPADDCTFWYTTEYLQADGSFNWSTEVGSFKFNSCTNTPPPPPAAPSNLVATANGAVEIDLSWIDNSNNESGFKIERCTGDAATCDANPTNYVQIATTGANVTSYANTGLTPNTTYSYRVRAYNAGGNSGYSNSAQATTLNLSPPNAPSNLTASAGSTSGKNKVDFVNLAWTNNSNNADSIAIERCTGTATTCLTGTFSQIATVSGTATTYKDNNLPRRTNFTYRVRAHNVAGNSGYSNTASTKTP